jgi:hypothetical protein
MFKLSSAFFFKFPQLWVFRLLQGCSWGLHFSGTCHWVIGAISSGHLMIENEPTTVSQNVRHQLCSDAEPYSRRLKFLVVLRPVKLAKERKKEKKRGGGSKKDF